MWTLRHFQFWPVLNGRQAHEGREVPRAAIGYSKEFTLRGQVAGYCECN